MPRPMVSVDCDVKVTGHGVPQLSAGAHAVSGLPRSLEAQAPVGKLAVKRASMPFWTVATAVAWSAQNAAVTASPSTNVSRARGCRAHRRTAGEVAMRLTEHSTEARPSRVPFVRSSSTAHLEDDGSGPGSRLVPGGRDRHSDADR